MILHIFNDQKKFSLGYFRMLAEHGFDLGAQVLHHYGTKDSSFDGLGIRTHFLRSWFLPQGHLRLVKDMRRADQIVVHSLAAPLLVLILALSRPMARKVTWVVWGKDLYLYALSERKPLLLRVYEFFRKRAIRNIGRVVTGFEEDYEELLRFYVTDATNVSCTLLYPYNVHLPQAPTVAARNEPYVVLLGNSASVTNEHLEILPSLAAGAEQIDQVIVPLSYGSNRRYTHRVVEAGARLLGERFRPITDFMAAADYFALLDTVDIAVFNHKRQEAFNNICSLLLRGVTVYLNDEISTARFLRRLGVVVGSCRDLDGGKLECASEAVRASNAAILRAELQVGRSVAKWREILRGEA